MIERFITALRASGVDARRAAQHTGACTAPYCVVYAGETSYGKTVAIRRVAIDAIVPVGKPELIADLVNAVCIAARSKGYRPERIDGAIVLEDYRAICRTIVIPLLCSL